ncbi:MAG TPA: hypothetical protein ENH82_01640 [bacterium]|nr:hypothetical protein [bacterium]
MKGRNSGLILSIRQGLIIRELVKNMSAKRNNEAAKHIDESLKALQTDHIDIYFFHELCQEKEWETVIGPKGAMEAFKKAQKEGKKRAK